VPLLWSALAALSLATPLSVGNMAKTQLCINSTILMKYVCLLLIKCH